MHNIVLFKYISESSAYLYRLTTQVASWTEDIELRDNNHLLIIMHFKAVMTMYLIFHSDVSYVKRHFKNPRELCILECNLTAGAS